MGYLSARADLKFMYEFRDLMIQMLNLEMAGDRTATEQYGPLRPGSSRRQRAQIFAGQNPEYPKLRQQVAKGVLRATRIARQVGAPVDGHSAPPPAVGGVIIPFTLFEVALNDNTYEGIEYPVFETALDETVGACEELVKKEFRRFINPFYWLREGLFFVLRIPFLLIDATGFDTSKVEDHLLGKIFKLLEIGGIIYVLVRLGFTKAELLESLGKLLP